MNISNKLIKGIEKYKEFQKYKSSVDGQLKALIPRVKEIATEKNRLKTANDELQDDNDFLQKQYDELYKENLKLSIPIPPQRIKKTQEYLKLKEINIQLEQQIKEQNALNDNFKTDLQNEIEQKNLRISKFPKEIDEKEKVIKGLKIDIFGKEAELLELNKIKKTNSRLQSEKNSLVFQNNKKDQQILEVSKSLEDLKNQFDALKLEYDKKSEGLDALKIQINSINADKDKQMDALKLQFDSINADKDKQLLDLQTQYTNKDKEIGALKLQIATIGANRDKEISSLQTKYANKDKEILDLKTQYANKDKEIDALKLKIENINVDKNKEMQSLISNIDSINANKDKQIGELKSDYEQKTREMAELKSKFDSIDDEIQQKDREIREKDREIKQKDREIKQKDHDNQLLKNVDEDNLRLKAELKKLQDAEAKRLEAHKSPLPKQPPSNIFPQNIYVLCENCIIKKDEIHILSGHYILSKKLTKQGTTNYEYQKKGSSITFNYDNNKDAKWKIQQHGEVVAVAYIGNTSITVNQKWIISNENFKKTIDLEEYQGNMLNLFISDREEALAVKKGGKRRRTNKRRKTNKRRRKTYKR
jgi:chromosome segregation ATPase